MYSNAVRIWSNPYQKVET